MEKYLKSGLTELTEEMDTMEELMKLEKLTKKPITTGQIPIK